MAPGDVILLNGTSSVGKSTIAGFLQDQLELPFLHTGVDHFLHRIPGRLIGPPEPGVVRGWEVDVADGVLTRPPTITAFGHQILRGVYAAIAAYCWTGNNVVVDDVIYDPQVLRVARDALRGLDVFWVGIDCTLEEVERRELKRGDRAVGGARVFYEIVHPSVPYDLRIDVTSISAAAAAEEIARAYLARRLSRPPRTSDDGRAAGQSLPMGP